MSTNSWVNYLYGLIIYFSSSWSYMLHVEEWI